MTLVRGIGNLAFRRCPPRAPRAELDALSRVDPCRREIARQFRWVSQIFETDFRTARNCQAISLDDRDEAATGAMRRGFERAREA